jgi:hypothetical protein
MLNQQAKFGGVFTVECRDADGNLKWSEDFPNLVVNTGLQFINTQFFKGVSYSATWYMGLVNGPSAGNTYLAANTMASHTGWTENVSYTQSARPTMAFGTATTADPSVIVTSTPVVFTMNATATIAGAFVTTDNTKSGTTGTLFSVGNFTVGDRGVVSGDTLNVTYTFSADAA